MIEALDPAEVIADEILRSLPLLTVRLPHDMARRNCVVVASPLPGVRIDAARWHGETVDLEIVRSEDGTHELTVFGVRHNKPWILAHHDQLTLSELVEVIAR